jgi:hypothetical protein
MKIQHFYIYCSQYKNRVLIRQLVEFSYTNGDSVFENVLSGGDGESNMFQSKRNYF